MARGEIRGGNLTRSLKTPVARSRRPVRRLPAWLGAATADSRGLRPARTRGRRYQPGGMDRR